MTRIIVSLLFLSSVFCCQAQEYSLFHSRYELSKQDYWIVGSALLMNGTAYLIRENLDAPTMAALNQLDRNDINRFDRAAPYNWSPKASDWSDRTEVASILFPLVLMKDKNGRKDFFKILLMGAETIAVNQGLTDLSKSITRRYRPLAYNEKDSRMKPIVWATAISLPAVTGLLRYEAGKHYLSDVIIAYGMGAMVGTLIPKMHESNRLKGFNASVYDSGLNISYRF